MQEYFSAVPDTDFSPSTVPAKPVDRLFLKWSRYEILTMQLHFAISMATYSHLLRS